MPRYFRVWPLGKRATVRAMPACDRFGVGQTMQEAAGTLAQYCSSIANCSNVQPLPAASCTCSVVCAPNPRTHGHPRARVGTRPWYPRPQRCPAVTAAGTHTLTRRAYSQTTRWRRFSRTCTGTQLLQPKMSKACGGKVELPAWYTCVPLLCEPPVQPWLAGLLKWVRGDRMWTRLSALYVAYSQSGRLTLHLIIKFSSYHCLNFENLIFASAIRAKSAHPAQQTSAFPASKHSG